MSEAPDTGRPSAATAYDDMGLDRRPANSVALTPLSFLERAATVYPHRTAIVYGQRRHDYADFRDRCRRLAVALAGAGVGRGDTVSVLLPNIPEMLECHFGVAMAGAVLNAINTRLDAASIAFFLGHAGSKVLIADRGTAAAVKAALARLETPPLLVEVDDPAAAGEPLGGLVYEDFLAAEADGFTARLPEDEWQAIALNYTSGTTGDPKGVVYHHRGAYLNALSNVLATELTGASVYLWTLPMFH